MDKALEGLIKEAIEIRLRPRSFNRDRSFSLGQFWYLVTNMIKQYQDKPIRRKYQDRQTCDSTR
jgi:hypothetical protein